MALPSGDQSPASGSVKWHHLSLTCIAYPEGDLLGYLLAWCSLAPIFLIVSFVTLIAFRRDLHTIFYFAGLILSEGCNYTLKHVIRQERPHQDLEHTRMIRTEYGMPSSHSQFILFFATYFCLFIFIRVHRNHQLIDELWRMASCLLAAVLAVAVCVSRIYLGYHSTSQVLCGAALGATLGIAWFVVVHLLLTPLFPQIAQLPICEYLLIRDLSLIPNAFWFEYTSSRSEARQRLRKVSKMN